MLILEIAALLGLYIPPSQEQDFICMAENIFFEAGISSFEDKVGVGQVVLNRVESHRYPDEICAVIYQHRQFSWTHQPQESLYNSKNLRSSIDAAFSVLYLMDMDITLNSTHYHADYVYPRWAKSLKHQVTIGRHLYYSR